ncbi:MAG: hypothetical protein IPO65_11935 [Saprospiraceae bacterium]|nr:hypothetical protein [Saprospiraceae bacterium]
MTHSGVSANWNTPWKLLAADVNQDGKISASDLVTLRKLILGTESALPNDKSWMFIWDGHSFADPANPWIAGLTETYNIEKLGMAKYGHRFYRHQTG